MVVSPPVLSDLEMVALTKNLNAKLELAERFFLGVTRIRETKWER